jgi:hypothetical protein
MVKVEMGIVDHRRRDFVTGFEWRSQMKTRFVIACVIVVGMASPALARNYYVVQNTKTHKCSVLPKKPKTKTVVIVSGSTAYKSRADARGALGTLAACKI